MTDHLTIFSTTDQMRRRKAILSKMHEYRPQGTVLFPFLIAQCLSTKHLLMAPACHSATAMPFLDAFLNPARQNAIPLQLSIIIIMSLICVTSIWKIQI